eukprot:2961774-Pleurochrysis_carterae.AAC.2
MPASAHGAPTPAPPRSHAPGLCAPPARARAIRAAMSASCAGRESERSCSTLSCSRISSSPISMFASSLSSSLATGMPPPWPTSSAPSAPVSAKARLASTRVACAVPPSCSIWPSCGASCACAGVVDDARGELIDSLTFSESGGGTATLYKFVGDCAELGPLVATQLRGDGSDGAPVGPLLAAHVRASCAASSTPAARGEWS